MVSFFCNCCENFSAVANEFCVFKSPFLAHTNDSPDQLYCNFFLSTDFSMSSTQTFLSKVFAAAEPNSSTLSVDFWALIFVDPQAMFSSHIVTLLLKTPPCDVPLWSYRSLTVPWFIFFFSLNPCSDVGCFSLQTLQARLWLQFLAAWVLDIGFKHPWSIHSCFSDLQIWLDMPCTVPSYDF